jgi:hypothetical protein
MRLTRTSAGCLAALIAKENLMRKFVVIAGLAAMLCLAVPAGFAKTPAAKSGTGTIVIVFKDGHRETFNLSEVARVEFPSAEASADSGPVNPQWPSRGRFLGKWEVGDGNGTNFYITLEENGEAKRSMGDVHGKWVYTDGEARVTWDDGAQDAIRKAGSHFQKFAYSMGKSFTDSPDNVTAAWNTTPRPI